MNILSKNAPLEESIKKMEAVLADVGCEARFSDEKHPLDNCYSVNLASIEAPSHIYSNGKGIVSNASKASALGEYIERLQTNNFFIDFYLPGRKYYPDEVVYGFDEAYLSDELRAIYDPNNELEDEDFVDYNSDYEDKIVCLPFIQHSTFDKVNIPINILSNLYVSNGLATGNTPFEAQVQALSEILERYAKIEIIKNGYALPHYPNEVIERYERVYNDVMALRAKGFIVEVLDASLGGQFPVTAISLINPENSTLFVSFGAHPILEVALERTMTELMQGRGLENLDAFEVPTFDMSVVSDSFNLESHFIDSNGKLGFPFLSSKKSFKYASWNYKGNGSMDEFDYLVSIVKKMDKEIYFREYDYLGFYSCQMIIPGLSEVYPIEDMSFNNKNNGKWIRDMVLNFEEYDGEDILDAIESLEETLNVEKYIGVLFENSFTMQEFKAQIHLLLGNTEEARSLLEFGTSKMGHIVAELIHMGEGDYEWEEYENALFNLYGQEKIKRALAILEGEEFLIDITLHNDYHNMLKMYDRLEKKKVTLSS
ncbi:MAG: YcaO-like family protein [Sulfuricurvum sp.]|uniref:YcaO-like family protein n=1 Tax=Sulfuricurvum sp. TaxID=2025608 RepID=UPI002605C1DD|nr:YcaO-like family protein [Sulfuricurvum sp.]MDD2829265.1 YcaO-like family protein [Sulfuricurvum sp.]MDD4949971.1 YcaO-like family protein [Sulfuricurvum sp.]